MAEGELDVDALLTATDAARFAGRFDSDGKPAVNVIVNWRNRGHLPQATDEAGSELRDGHGRRLYRLIDVAKAENATRQRAAEMARVITRSCAW